MSAPQRPSVDVVVPCYKYGMYLRECVYSVLNQAGVDVRVLIVDDCSPDDTPEVASALAREDNRVTYIRHAQNRGHIATYNEGIAWTSGSYFLLLSADDYLLPGALLRATELMERSPEVAFVFGRAVVVRDGLVQDAFRPLPDCPPGGHMIMTGTQFVERSGAENIVPTPSAVVRGELQRRVGGYRSSLPHSGDMEMWLRLAAHGAVGYIDADQAAYRQHSSNMSRDYFAAMLPDMQQRRAAIECFFDEHGKRLPQSNIQRQRMTLALARMAVGRASAAFNEGKTDVCEALSEFARDLDPRIATSAHWWRLRVKRGLGVRTWRTVHRMTHAVVQHS